MTTITTNEAVWLPMAKVDGEVSLEKALQKRRSVREYGQKRLSQAEVGQLLWAAQGISGPRSYKRTAPSAGGLCPLEMYVLVGEVEGRGGRSLPLPGRGPQPASLAQSGSTDAFKPGGRGAVVAGRCAGGVCIRGRV